MDEFIPKIPFLFQQIYNRIQKTKVWQLTNPDPLTIIIALAYLTPKLQQRSPLLGYL